MQIVGGLFCTLLFASTLQSQQQLLVQHSWWDTGAESFTDCVAVQDDGSYQFEHTSVYMAKPDHRQIHAGKISDEESKQLSDILNDPALRSLNTPKPSGGFAGTDVWFFSIKRDDQPQLLWFATTAGVNLVPAVKLPNVNQTPAMKPLLAWFKQLSKRKDDVDKAATPRCSLKIKEGFGITH
jgi:hypothetical protein